MATLAVRQALIVDGNVVEGATTTDQAISLTLGRAYTVLDVTVADNYGEDILWQASDGGIDEFTHCYIYSTQDIWVALRNDASSAEFVRLFIPANILAWLPGRVGGDGTNAFDGAALAEGTDWDHVDRVEVYRDAADGQGDASVSLFMFA